MNLSLSLTGQTLSVIELMSLSLSLYELILLNTGFSERKFLCSLKAGFSKERFN